MEEKRPLAGEAQAPSHTPSTNRRFGVHVLFVLACLTFFYWPGTNNSSACVSNLRSYDNEALDWQECGYSGKYKLECSEVIVPMDQFNSTNSGDKTFSIPLIRLRSDNATKNLLINPGGPGGSGVEFLHTRGERLRTVVGDGFHLVSFDPRGVNMSRPLASCYPDDDARQKLEIVRDTKVLEDSVDLYAWTTNYVRACADNMGDHGKYINTPQTAADMNSILDALGQRDMYYWGFSYGTLLGQTYATIFPERSHRVIIDGVVDQFAWYEKLIDAEDLVDSDKVLYGFADECIKAGKRCSLSSLASTTDELLATLTNLGEELKSDRISVYVNNTVYGVIDHNTIWFNAIFPTLYKPARWHELADRLTNLLNGNATDAFLEYGQGPLQAMPGDALYMVHLNDARSGPKHWPQKRTDLVDMLLPAFNLSTFSTEVNKFHYAKQQWIIPQTHKYIPTKGIHTAGPLLIMSTTYDPVCPLASARVARDSFEGSRLVELKGYGHCTLAMESTCVVKYVRDFLYKGDLPSDDVQCDADNNYFTPPDETLRMMEEAAEHESEEQHIRAAQLALARDMQWFSKWV
ncbi:putative hydrolase [Paramyrothecium foliicola]|nr:putative hydrolase [Paramyrothecium foliicola]